MSDQQAINVHVQSGTGEILRIVATILLFGGAGAVAWSVAQGAYKEQAATGFSMLIVMMVKLMYSRGLIQMPAGGGEDFAATKTMLTQVGDEYRRWLAGTSMPAMTLIAAGYAVAFLIMRAGVAAGLGVFQNLYVAGGVAAMVGALVVFPSLVPNMIAGLKSKGVVAAPAPVAASRVEPQAVAPAPRAQAAPSSPAPQVAAPVTGPTAQDASPQPRIMRRIKNQEN